MGAGRAGKTSQSKAAKSVDRGRKAAGQRGNIRAAKKDVAAAAARVRKPGANRAARVAQLKRNAKRAK